MSRKGHYLGAHTIIGPKSPNYFTKDSIGLPKDDGGKPDSAADGRYRAARCQRSKI